ncbi:MAG: hypothetical protein P4L40_15540 [Terracidiphilus sp.]|nr:hypothetical protein [Terracidiphilus sp.]
MCCAVQMANGETTFEAMPWGFDNLYVGESPADAISHLQRTFYPVRDIERGLPECPFLPY